MIGRIEEDAATLLAIAVVMCVAKTVLDSVTVEVSEDICSGNAVVGVEGSLVDWIGPVPVRNCSKDSRPTIKVESC